MNLVQSFRRLGQQMNGWQKAMDNQYHQLKFITKLYEKNGLSIIMTCPACPEQYDIFKGDVQVAYYRLRHGEFRVEYPDVMGEEIYYAEPNGDGIFDEDERFIYLTKAMREVIKRITE